MFDARSREGKYLVHIERQLLAPLGPTPSFGQKMLARRAARAALQLELLDEKMAKAKDWSTHDLRTYHALQNGLRLLVRELDGLKPAKDKVATLDDVVARIKAASP
jgi:hypothetical protein